MAPSPSAPGFHAIANFSAVDDRELQFQSDLPDLGLTCVEQQLAQFLPLSTQPCPPKKFTTGDPGGISIVSGTWVTFSRRWLAQRYLDEIGLDGNQLKVHLLAMWAVDQ